jgi:biopolymer transport protein ExbB/TolQ
MLLEITKLKRGLAVLADVGATAPFVGLLGTTVGIINSFTAWPRRVGGGLASIGGGISEALATTAFGLLVAIRRCGRTTTSRPKIDNLTAEMTYVSKEMIDYSSRACRASSAGRASPASSTPRRAATRRSPPERASH